MTSSLFLESIVERIEDQVEQIQAISKELGEHQINWKPNAKRWTMAQIFEHMLMATNMYVPEIKAALISTHRSPADPEASPSWFGRIIAKGAGPSGNAPVPKQLVPGSGLYRRDIVDRWIARHQEIIALARQARGIDLTVVPMRNPFFPIFKMNRVDFFEILAAHTERHVGQIEELDRQVPRAISSETTEKEPFGVR
jgi:hypothetical protein